MEYKSFRMGQEVIKQIIFGVLYYVQFSPEYQRLAIKTQTQRIVRIAKSFPDFVELPETLQQLLLKRNTFMVYTLIQASMDNLKSIDSRIGRYYHPEDIVIMKSMFASVMASNKKNDYDSSIFKPEKHVLVREFDDDEKHQMYQFLKSVVRENTAHDHNVVSILAYSLLFSSDNISGDKISNSERQKLDDIQEKLLSRLQRYLRATNQNCEALSHFRKSIETLTRLKEVPDVMK